ncbi:MAG: hypothetical protein E7380_02655 [Clostridiales bacterium]|nr:hypothetical protein [Clostridiales bacterium]
MLYYNISMNELLQKTRAFRLLKTEYEENRLSHAYLLLLEDTRNLRFALKTFAKVLFSSDGQNERIARLIDAESFSDCLFFPQAGKKLTVEDAEKIKEECTLKPLEGDKKVFVLGDFAEANVQTQNKLLKLLEEPPQGVYFLLGATSVYPLLSTVLSRTKRLDIQPFNVEETDACLERIYGEKYEKNSLLLCAAAANGNVGKAQSMLEGGYYKTLLSSAFSLCLADSSSLPLVVKQIGESKHAKELLSSLRLIFRDALLIKTGQKEKNLLLSTEKETLKKVASRYTLPALFYAQEALSNAEREVAFNAVFPQCIELCLAKIQSKNK